MGGTFEEALNQPNWITQFDFDKELNFEVLKVNEISIDYRC